MVKPGIRIGRPLAVSDRFGLRNGPGDKVLGLFHGLNQRMSLGPKNGNGRRKGTAGPMNTFGLYSRTGKLFKGRPVIKKVYGRPG